MKKWIKEMWTTIKFWFVPKRKRVYRITRCANMPSVVGFKVYGTPVDGVPFIAVHNTIEGYRNFVCIRWKRDVKHLYICNTRYMQMFMKRIR